METTPTPPPEPWHDAPSAPESRPYAVCRLTGQCLDGAERDGGTVYHAVRGARGAAACGARPGRASAGWSQREGVEVTCPGCLKRLPMDPTPALLHVQGYHGYYPQPCTVIGQTPKFYRITPVDKPLLLGGRSNWLNPGEKRLVPKRAVTFHTP